MQQKKTPKKTHMKYENLFKNELPLYDDDQ